MSEIRWRGFRREDETKLRQAHARQCAALGTDFGFPDLNDPHYFLAATGERDGEVEGAIVAHATTEVMFLGGNRHLLRHAIERRGRFEQWLRAAGADEAHAFIPATALPQMHPLLRRLGFRRSNPEFIPYYREL
jgi:hypothetical protein